MRKPNSRSELMKRSSRSLIMMCVGRTSGVSRSDIVRETGLSRAHVYAVVDELIAQGELIETGSVSAGRGRPKTLLEVNVNSTYVGAVWLAEDHIEVAIAGATGRTLARQTLQYSGDSANDVDSIASAFAACAAQARVCTKRVRGVGVVVAGLVNPALGLICAATHKHYGFVGVPIAKVLQEKLGVPVVADTDIRAAAVADRCYSRESERVLYVQFGEAVGAAFVISGELFGGAHGAAPLLGYAPILDGISLEKCTSDYAFVDALWPDLGARTLAPEQFREMVRRGIDLATRGDARAVGAVKQIAKYMGFGITVALSMLDPHKIRITGTLIDCFPKLMVDIIRREALSSVDPLLTGVDIQPLVGWTDFGLRGAYGLVLLDGFRSLNRDIDDTLIAPWRAGSEADGEEAAPVVSD